MSFLEIATELDEEVCQLCNLRQTFVALEIAATQGDDTMPGNALTLPCKCLENISENLTSLVIALFDLYEESQSAP